MERFLGGESFEVECSYDSSISELLEEAGPIETVAHYPGGRTELLNLYPSKDRDWETSP